MNIKFLVVGDVHFSQYSSILRKRGQVYSVRLENCIRSINWAESLAEQCGCAAVIYLGDFFDKADLNAEEITALQDICWNNKDHIFLTGNHELSTAFYSSAQALKSVPNAVVVDNYSTVKFGDTTTVWIPYLKTKEERDRVIKRVAGTPNSPVVFSHNDLKNIQMGAFKTKEGIDADELDKSCSLCINGHLHNGEWARPHILNIGNLTGQNFSEDADLYKHRVAILSLQSHSPAVELIENPHSFKFYKTEITRDTIYKIKNYPLNTVITVKTDEELLDAVKDAIYANPNIVEFKIVIKPKQLQSVEGDQTIESSRAKNITEQFIEYTLSRLENTALLGEELAKLQENPV